MTEHCEKMLARNRKVFAYYLKAPDLTYQEIGDVFGYKVGVIGNIIRREKLALLTGEPSYKARAPKNHPKRGKYKRYNEPILFEPKINNPEELWNQLQASFA